MQSGQRRPRRRLDLGVLLQRIQGPASSPPPPGQKRILRQRRLRSAEGLRRRRRLRQPVPRGAVAHRRKRGGHARHEAALVEQRAPDASHRRRRRCQPGRRRGATHSGTVQRRAGIGKYRRQFHGRALRDGKRRTIGVRTRQVRPPARGTLPRPVRDHGQPASVARRRGILPHRRRGVQRKVRRVRIHVRLLREAPRLAVATGRGAQGRRADDAAYAPAVDGTRAEGLRGRREDGGTRRFGCGWGDQRQRCGDGVGRDA
mmetsp:Transcript_21804/g.52726  ORF Transcript_21804/g.52726 Transcript_21804/m.52726 type:complete len:259 (-) Transcript_21804:369-1145(-)